MVAHLISKPNNTFWKLIKTTLRDDKLKSYENKMYSCTTLNNDKTEKMYNAGFFVLLDQNY